MILFQPSVFVLFLKFGHFITNTQGLANNKKLYTVHHVVMFTFLQRRLADKTYLSEWPQAVHVSDFFNF